jgi:xanthine dehydrogenase accessory factor
MTAVQTVGYALDEDSMTFFEQLNDLIATGTPVVSVTVVDTAGSVPNERGSKMLVTAGGLHFGTVGGGKVEKRALDEAQEMLRGGPSPRFFQWQLNKDIGMTCGGMIKIYFEAFNVATWNIVIFGAGHVANALITLLERLDCRITCYDPRAEWIDKLPPSPRLSANVVADMPSVVGTLPADAFVVLMSSGHTTDKPVLLEILRTREFPFLGVIGSRAKAKRLRQDVTEAGLPEEAQTKFHCPVGLPLGTNHPQEIAVSVAAQLLQERDRLRGVERGW